MDQASEGEIYFDGQNLHYTQEGPRDSKVVK